ncbi:MAG: phenylalanine--tRNA ligase subunit beta [Thermodesulfobacteriota bacterium]
MRVNFNWLRDYVDLDGVSPTDLADRLTMVGLEVEEVSDRYAYLDTVAAARVVAVENHPGSGHLKICRVEAGGSEFQVVCGAPNARAGLVSALARPGTVLPEGEVVGDTEIRGVRSQGMLCSEAELMVGPDPDGIMDLPASAQPGRPLKEVLGLSDWIFEIGVTPNRPDCLCVLGVAREVAGLLGRPLRYPRPDLTEADERIEDLTSVKVLDPDHCPRYVARVIREVKIGPSPFWMRSRLAAAGVRSINNIVDITNFVLMEMGQPLHAFDMDRLEERRIVVRLARTGDRFTTLDGTERIMGPEMLMICDGRQAVGLAGVMGGLNSEIVNETRDVLLESAYFNPVSIRRTSKRLGLSTEASYRFERGLDPEGCPAAADRAIALMAELAGGRVAAGVIDVRPKPQPPVRIPFSPARCNAFLGTDFSADEMKKALAGIEIKTAGEGEEFEVLAPSFRVDLTRDVDLYEEVARLGGFNRVPVTLPPARVEPEPPEPSRVLRMAVRDILESRGLSEAICYTFIAENFPRKLGLSEDDPRAACLRILNPLSEEQALMRTTLVPGLLEVLRRNQAFGVRDAALYEIGVAYLPRPGREQPHERLTVGGLLTGGRSDVSWHGQAEPVDFYDLKGVVEDVLEGLRVKDPVFAAVTGAPFLDSTGSAGVTAGGRDIGWLGRLSDRTAEAFDLKGQVYVFELDLEGIAAVGEGRPRYQALPRFPAVERDLAVVLDREVRASEVLEAIKGLAEEFLSDVFLFDVYEGRQVAAGRRSLAFRLVYRSLERTLTDEEVNAMHQRVTDQVLARFSATLR